MSVLGGLYLIHRKMFFLVILFLIILSIAQILNHGFEDIVFLFKYCHLQLLSLWWCLIILINSYLG